MSVRKTLGYALFLSPFVGLGVFMFATLGLRDSLTVIGIAAAIIGPMAAGAHLLDLESRS